MTKDGCGGFRRRRRLAAGCALAGLGAVGMLLCGCQMAKVAAYYLRPTSEKVAPEFNRLEGKQVLIYVWAPVDILFDYPKLRLDLSAYLGAYFKKHVPKVKMIDPVQVERYIEQQRIAELDAVELGRHFKADMVVHLSVHQFSVRDPEMAHFYRGRVGSSVQVLDLANPEEPERITLQDVKVVVPEQGPVGLDNTTAAIIRQQAYDAFTVEVGKKFHEWERPLD